jgi:hypothetical protein
MIDTQRIRRVVDALYYATDDGDVGTRHYEEVLNFISDVEKLQKERYKDVPALLRKSA